MKLTSEYSRVALNPNQQSQPLQPSSQLPPQQPQNPKVPFQNNPQSPQQPQRNFQQFAQHLKSQAASWQNYQINSILKAMQTSAQQAGFPPQEIQQMMQNFSQLAKKENVQTAVQMTLNAPDLVHSYHLQNNNQVQSSRRLRFFS
jgi:hypothetical protein